jgi:hypothetical protein
MIFCALSASAEATSVALIVTPKLVAIAADSRSMDANGRIQSDVCKIRRVGDIVYVPNRFVGDGTTGYSLDKTVFVLDSSKGRWLNSGACKQ